MIESQAAARFVALFGREPMVIAQAPGRVNLIGEHTDYNDGYVMPMATPQRTAVAMAGRHDGHVRVWSANVAPGDALFDFTLGDERRTGRWGDYIQGVVVSLRAAGWRVQGFDACFVSDVPLGAGLSSSASLEIACVRALRLLFGLPVDDVDAAKIGRAAETDFVGAPVGIMDQMAASLCTLDEALFLDTRTLAWERLALPNGGELLVIDSGQRHHHVSGGYRVRRQECAEAAARLGLSSLRELAIVDLAIDTLPSPLDRRVRHVVSENARVLAMRDALRAGDLAAAGRLMDASHASMRDDFEVSTPEIDQLVALTRRQAGVFGVRLTGGGFGGSIVALVPRGEAASIGARVLAGVDTHAGSTPVVRIPYTG